MIIPPIGSLSLGGAEGAAGASSAAGVGSLASQQPAGGEAAGAPNFSGALTEAVSSLEGAQLKSDAASQALAAGTVKDPSSAVVTVEDAAMAMQLAAQIRAKATEAAQTIFQTQV